ncbi:MAG: coproporphyrinogen III oxidase, partial [Bacteroidetes bacterium]|nr:coproporphyrinogen III oxidase [Bacteroidota bacterium]
DDLYKAWKNNTLHRNFMGYTTQNTSMLLGLGVSAISDTGDAFAQNIKTLHDYYAAIEKDELPVQKGYFLNDEDLAFRRYILNISCQGKTTFLENHLSLLETYTFPELEKLAADGLILYNDKGLSITELGQNFIRNICKAFDLHLLRNTQAKPIFSKAI